jgi:hypothetical protein
MGRKSKSSNTKEAVSEKKEIVTLKEQFDMLFSEYQIGMEHTKRYAGYANFTLNLTLTALGAMIAWITSGESLLI